MSTPPPPPPARPPDVPADMPADVPEGLRADFFEAVRRIVAAAGIDGPGVGDDTRPADEPVRFAAMRGARHPAAEIAAALPADGGTAGGHVRIEAGFMGLTGPMGVMPDHYTELVVARDRARDAALGAFLDLFNHRAISLFYRAWAKYRLPVAFAADRGALRDPVSVALAALAGLDGPPADPRMLAAAGLLARRVRTADGLRRALDVLFGLPVAVIELRPRRIRIADDDRTRLGNARGRGAYSRLGVDAVAGASTMDVAGRFRVRIGPLDAAAFDAFLNDGGLHDRFVAAIRQVAGATADFDLQLVLAADAVPPVRLAGAGAAGTRLGRDGWLLHAPATRDRDDAVRPGRRLAA